MELADALVEGLLALGVRQVFGVGGANIEHVHDAIHRRGRGRLVSVLAKREDGAACMADYFARVNRRLGVCCATSGGGMMNLIAGIAESYQSSVPVLALVGQPPTGLEGRGAFQDSSGIGRTVNAVQMFSAVSKFTRKVDSAERFWDDFEQAVVAALEGRPGPSVLLFPRSIYIADVPDRVAEFVARVNDGIRPRSPVADDEFRGALDRLRFARRPMMIVGQGAQRTRARRALFEFADALDIPVATTMAARGEFPNDHRNYLGIVGLAGHPSVHSFIRDRADLLLLAGTSLNVMTRGPFMGDKDCLASKEIIAISADLGELRRSLAVKLVEPSRDASGPRLRSPDGISCAIEGDLGTSIERLYHLWQRAPFKVRGLGQYVQENFVPQVAPRSPRPVTASGGTAPLRQSEALECLEPHLPVKGNILYDAGNCASAALHFLPVPRGVTSVIPLGMGAMGHGIAGAIGAQLGAPEGSRTIVLAGDGAFLMLGFEIHTAVDLNLPILFVIFNNGMHGMCATRQNVFFESRYEAVTYSPLDVAGVSRGLGSEEKLWVAKASTRDQLERALQDFARNPMRPGVLELVLTVEEVPPFTPFVQADAPTQPLSRPHRHSLVSRTSPHLDEEEEREVSEVVTWPPDEKTLDGLDADDEDNVGQCA